MQQTHLDGGRLGVGLSGFTGNLTLDNESSDIILFVEVEELPNSSSTLGTET
jgi:hypothetical protein